jgi:PPIC-type PPIASE domain
VGNVRVRGGAGQGRGGIDGGLTVGAQFGIHNWGRWASVLPRGFKSPGRPIATIGIQRGRRDRGGGRRSDGCRPPPFAGVVALQFVIGRISGILRRSYFLVEPRTTGPSTRNSVADLDTAGDTLVYSVDTGNRSWLLALTLLTACSAPPPPALQVGDLVWAESELLGLSDARRIQLAELAALGMAISDGNALEVLDPAIQVDLNSAWITQAALEAQVRKMGAGDEQLRVEYEAAPEWELTVRHVLFFSERFQPAEHRANARLKAEAALVRLRDGEPFPDIAAELSEEPGAEGRQGLLTPGREGAWVPEFWAAAIALDVGEISPVTETQYGFHVLRLEDRRVVPFAEARANVVRRVASLGNSIDAVRAQWLAELAAEITLYEEEILSFVDDATPVGRVLADWPEGSLDDETFFIYLANDGEAQDRVDEGDVDVVAEIIREVAQMRLASDRAQAMNVELPASEEARIYQEWERVLFRWTESLGFQPEASGSEIKAAARAALDKTGQAANIARTEIRQFGSILLAFYGVSLVEAE